VCKADNPQGPQCRRCKADLSLLFALEEQRQRTLAEARHCLRRGEWQAAVEHAAMANWLRCDEDSRQLAAVAHLLRRDYAGALQYYRDWKAARQLHPNRSS
jgi:hypothetical protein